MKQIFVLVACILAMTRANAWQMQQAPLMTQWASQIDTNAPLPEYPRPQLVRSNWLNLNGLWQFQAGTNSSDPVPTNQTLSSQILVPYPMESAISGVMQYNAWSWYRRTFTVPAGWGGQRIILHLDAVNWQSQVYINGHNVGMHKGGYDPISYDITSYLNGGTNELIVQVYSPEDNGGEPRGKQTLYPGGVMYTSSSGIWQSVWLEPVDSSGVQNLLIIPDVDNSRLRLTVNTYATNGVTVYAKVLDADTVVNTAIGNPQTELDIPIASPQLWSPNSPFLYDLQITVVHNGVTNDTVSSYFGMRKISANQVAGRWRLFLNNQYLFELGPLDQGFWPDGLYTAPTDAARAYDIQMEKAFGFNMVRKHLKVEPPRWYYWADKLGILVWQDMPSCNTYTGSPNPPAVDPVQFTIELSAMVTNHLNSPSIIMWDIFNEGQGEAGSYNGAGQTNTAYLVQLVKNLDPSRLVNQASGWNWVGAGDVDDIHNYPEPGNPINNVLASVDGEFGSIGYVVPGHMWFGSNYTYGSAFTVSTTNALVSYYDYFVNELVSYEPSARGGLNAGVYTEITDMETESAGLLTYDRLLKVDPTVISNANQNVNLVYNFNTDSVAVTTNFSFEEDTTPPGTAFTYVPTGWTAFNEGASGDIGSQNAGGGDYTVNNPLAAPANGDNFCYVNLYNNPNASTGIYVDVGALQANTTYSLTVTIGSRLDIQTLPGIISLVNGTNNAGTVLASTYGVPATPNSWQDYTVTYTTGPSVSGDLTIVLWVDPTLTGGQVANDPGVNDNVQGDFDNVRLTAISMVPVSNPSFEVNVASGSGQLVSSVPTGWTAFNEAGGSDIGSQWAGDNNGNYDYTVNNPLAAPADGNQYCYVNMFNPSVTGGIYQDVGALQPNTTYNLTVAIGSRNDRINSPGIISLINGINNNGTVLASTNGLPATQNTWQNYTVSFTTGSAVSGDLTIVLSVLGNGTTIQADFDNVRLTVAPFPLVLPTLARPHVSQGNLIVTGTGGTPRAGYTWLATTNLSAPILWKTNSTSTLDSGGSFSNAIPINPTQPAGFFRLRMP
jgi:hypothetical protein